MNVCVLYIYRYVCVYVCNASVSHFHMQSHGFIHVNPIGAATPLASQSWSLASSDMFHCLFSNLEPARKQTRRRTHWTALNWLVYEKQHTPTTKWEGKSECFIEWVALPWRRSKRALPSARLEAFSPNLHHVLASFNQPPTKKKMQKSKILLYKSTNPIPLIWDTTL